MARHTRNIDCALKLTDTYGNVSEITSPTAYSSVYPGSGGTYIPSYYFEKVKRASPSKKKFIEETGIYAAARSYNNNLQYPIVGFNLGAVNTYVLQQKERTAFYAISPSYLEIYTMFGDMPPYYTVVLDDIVLYPQNMSPSASAVAADKITFSWSIESISGEDGEERYQKSATIQWTADSVNINTVDVGEKIYSHEFPANTFPLNATIKWRMKIVSDDDVDSGFSDWTTFSTADVAGTVRGLSPNDTIIDDDVINRVSWLYSHPYGRQQAKFELEISPDGVSWSLFASKETSNCYFDIPEKTFLAGTAWYRVRAYSQSGTVSDWAVASVTVRSKPAPPSVMAIDGSTDRPVVNWESKGQEAYELTVTDTAGKAVYKHYAASPERSHKITVRLDNAQYIVNLKIRDKYNFESPVTKRQFTVSATKPQKPTISGLTYTTYNAISFPLLSRAVLLRDGIAIADISNSDTYDDYTAPPSCEYCVRALSDTAFCDSEPILLDSPRRKATIVLADNYDVRVCLIYRANAHPERSSTIGAECTLLQFAGRKSPVAEYGEHITRTKTLSYSLRKREDLETLISIVGHTVIWNDKNEHMAASMSGLSYSEHSGYYDISFSLSEVDYSEAITYD